jgi:type IV pilus assembly protein PilV
MKSKNRQRGFSLLEALIGIVVIAFGFIGVAGLQLSALKDTQTSRNVTIATILGRDMADRIRINGVAVKDFDFSVLPTTSPANCVGDLAVCTPTNFFEAQYSTWISSVQAQLNGGEGIVCRTSTPNSGSGASSPGCTNGATDSIVVKVWWTEKDRTVSTKERYVMPLFARDGLMK